MGQIAEDMVDGDCCQLCGQYFQESNGIPSVCVECWYDLTVEERKEYQLSIFELEG